MNTNLTLIQGVSIVTIDGGTPAGAFAYRTYTDHQSQTVHEYIPVINSDSTNANRYFVDVFRMNDYTSGSAPSATTLVASGDHWADPNLDMGNSALYTFAVLAGATPAGTYLFVLNDNDGSVTRFTATATDGTDNNNATSEDNGWSFASATQFATDHVDYLEVAALALGVGNATPVGYGQSLQIYSSAGTVAVDAGGVLNGAKFYVFEEHEAGWEALEVQADGDPVGTGGWILLTGDPTGAATGTVNYSFVEHKDDISIPVYTLTASEFGSGIPTTNGTYAVYQNDQEALSAPGIGVNNGRSLRAYDCASVLETLRVRDSLRGMGPMAFTATDFVFSHAAFGPSG